MMDLGHEAVKTDAVHLAASAAHRRPHQLSYNPRPRRCEEARMPHRHWYVVLTADGEEHRTGPYATRKTAERKAQEHHKNAPAGDVSVIYDAPPPTRRPGR
jgi:hypothetical protein